MLGCTQGLRLTINKVHVSMIFGKNMTIFVKSGLFNEELRCKLLSKNHTQYTSQISGHEITNKTFQESVIFSKI